MGVTGSVMMIIKIMMIMMIIVIMMIIMILTIKMIMMIISIMFKTGPRIKYADHKRQHQKPKCPCCRVPKKRHAIAQFNLI